MNRMILIPIVGTIAAVIAVALAREEQEGTSYPLLNEPPPRTPRIDPEPEPEPEPEEEVADPVKPKPPIVRRYFMEVKEDGTFSVIARMRDKSAEPEPVEHESIEKFLEAVAGAARPTVHLYATSDKVTAEQLEQVAKQLRERCEVVIQKR